MKVAGVGLLLVLTLPLVVSGQQPGSAKPPAVPSRPYRAPRTPDGKPDFNGIWQALNEAYWDIEGHAAAPGLVRALGASAAVAPGLGIVEGGPIPYQPTAAAQKKENYEKRLTLDPEI